MEKNVLVILFKFPALYFIALYVSLPWPYSQKNELFLRMVLFFSSLTVEYGKPLNDVTKIILFAWKQLLS